MHSASRSDRVRLQMSGPTAHLILNRPDKLNAIDLAMTDALESVLAELEMNDSVRVLIISGEGRAFCAGEDIRENAQFSPEESVHQAERRAAICRHIGSLPFPVIARVHGACIGGGLMMALGADWIFSTPDAQFALPEIKLGWPPAYSMNALRDRIGFAAARDLAILGKTISAQEAKHSGLVSNVLQAMLMDREIELLQQDLILLFPSACRETRRLLRPSHSDTANLAAYSRARSYADAQTGMKRFLG